MSIEIKIPVNSIPRQTASQFTGVWSQAPHINLYSFNPTIVTPANNINTLIMPMNKNSIYLLSGIGFSCDIPEGDFKSSINTIPELQLNKLSTGVQIFQNRIPFINYVDSQEFVYFFSSQMSPEALQGTFTGLLNQIPATVGDLEIIAQVQLNIYQIIDTRWQAKFFDPKTQLGNELAMRGSARVPRGRISF